MYTSKELIEKLDLIPHPEGGYYKEEYRSSEKIDEKSLPNRYNGNRSFATSIYFLLENDQFSAFHKLRSDEIWHFYSGSPVLIHQININGKYNSKVLGMNISNEEKPQIIISRGNWFGAEIIDKKKYSLVGCTVSPGFDFNDFEIGDREKLLTLFPAHKEIITQLTR
jgi:predicted cupin superfamily sugar epimerase